MVRFLMWYILLIDFGHVGQSQHGTETSHAGDINSALVCATTHVDSLFLTLEIRWEWKLRYNRWETRRRINRAQCSPGHGSSDLIFQNPKELLKNSE